jgi:hypothetical protein
MNYFSKIKIGTWVVIVLTLINLASLGTILYKTKCAPPPPPFGDNNQPDKKPNKDNRWKNLNLDAQQEKNFRQRGRQYFKEINTINSKRDSLAKIIANELKKEKPDITLMENNSRQMGDCYTQLKVITVHHLIDLKSLCKPDQVLKLDSMYFFLLVGFEKDHHRMRDPRMDSIKRSKPMIHNERDR